jgi:hypothetical protein
MQGPHFLPPARCNSRQSSASPAKEKERHAMTRQRSGRQGNEDWPELLSVAEAAAFLRLTRSTLDHYRCEGRGPVYRKHGARVFYPKPDLIRWSERNAYASTSEKLRDSK